MRAVELRRNLWALGLLVVFFSGRCERATESQRARTIAGHKELKAFLENSDSPGPMVSAVIFEDRDGTYWAGTPLGVFSYTQNTDRWKSSSINGEHISRSVKTICQSSDGRIWFHSALFHSITTYQNGKWDSVDKLGPFSTHPSAILLAANSGRVWIVQQGRLFCYDNDHWENPVTIPSEFAIDSQSGGRTRPGSSPPAPKLRITPNVSVGIESSNGTLWMGTKTAVFTFKPATRQWLAYRLPEKFNSVFMMYEDSSGRIWIADTEWHVSAYDKRTDTWSMTLDVGKHITASNVLLSSTSFGITGICQDKAGVIIFGSYLGLISLDESAEHWSIFTPENSMLPDENVTSLMRDRKGRILLGTGKGIVLLEE